MPTIELMRPDEKSNQLAEMEVYLNGQLLGKLLNNECKTFDIPPGRHRLKARIDTQGSKTSTFTITANQTKTFIISTDNEANSPEPLVSGSILDFIVVPLQLLYYFTIGHNRYLSIAEHKLK